jgi:hypothetical protein
MNLVQRSFVSSVILCGFAAFGWLLAIALTFAAESKSSLGFFERPSTAFTAFAAAGILAAIGSFRRRSPNKAMWFTTGFAACSLIAFVFVHLR